MRLPILALFALSSCVPAATMPSVPPSGTTTVVSDEPSGGGLREVRGTPIDAPAVGECGGLDTLPATESNSLLSDRLRIRLPVGTHARTTSAALLSSYGRSEQARQTVFLGTADGIPMVLEVEEIFETASSAASLVSVLRARADADAVASALRTRGGTEVAVVRHRSLETTESRVEVLRAYAIAADGHVVMLRFLASLQAAQTGGCVDLAENLVRTLEPGTRPLPDDAGRRSVRPNLAIDVPEGFHVSIEGSYDWQSVRVRECVPFGETASEMLLESDRYSRDAAPGEVVRTIADLLGDPSWLRSSEEDGRLHAWAPLELAGIGGTVHLHAKDRPSFDRLSTIVRSLERQEHPPRSTLRCADEPRTADTVLAEAPMLVDEDVQMLRAATRLARGYASLGEGPLPEARAFRRIMGNRDARSAFLDLAAHGTTAGKLYGLAGLWWVDRALFDAVVCAVQASLEAEVEVLDPCGAERRSTRSILVDSEGIRGERFWWEEAWSGVLPPRHADVAGGGLGIVLTHPDAAGRELTSLAAALGTEGAEALAPTAFVPQTASRSDSASLPSFFVRGGEILYLRDDGRVMQLPMPSAAASEPPDLVRFPRDYVDDGSIACALDGGGRRICRLDADAARATVQRACGIRLEEGPVVRPFSDGPYLLLLDAWQRACALRDDGALGCFVRLSNTGALPGEEAPAGWGEFVTWGWNERFSSVFAVGDELAGVTRDGRVLVWGWGVETFGFAAGAVGYESSRLGPVAGLRAIRGDRQNGLFFELEDGRVLVLGSFDWQRDSRVDGPSNAGPEALNEVPELHGATVSALGGLYCALRSADRRVFCWGRNAGLDPSLAHDARVPPREIEALRGSESLLLTERHGVCAAMSGSTLRCLEASPSERDGTRRARPPRVYRVDRRARFANPLGRLP